MKMMKAAVFIKPGTIALQEKPIPKVGVGEAFIKVTTTTICGTDVHILKGEYPVDPGRIVGHEPVGIIAELGAGITGYEVGQRVIVGAITPCGQCFSCLDHHQAQCGGKAIGGGVLATPLMAAKQSMCWCPMRWQTWHSCLIIFLMKKF